MLIRLHTSYRSEDMTLFQIRVPKDDAWEVMNHLGEMDIAHFINLNKTEQPFNLPYANQIKRSEETERRILYYPFFILFFDSYILDQCKTMGIKIVKPADIKSFLDSLKDISKHKKKAANLLFEEIENEMNDKEKFVIE